MENDQIKQKLPGSIILILIFIGGGTILWVSKIFKYPSFQLGPVFVTGVGSIIVNLVIVGIMGIIFYGIIKRLSWARKLAISMYIFLMAQSLINLISFFANKTMYNSYFQEFYPTISSLRVPVLMTSSLTSALINGWIIGFVVIFYLIRKKDFFVN